MIQREAFGRDQIAAVIDFNRSNPYFFFCGE